MKRLLTALTSIFSLLAFSGVLLAQNLEVPVGSQSRAAVGQLPINGHMQQDVLNLVGEPQSRRGPVGDPPISSWDYGDYVVYFEYGVVLHTVVKPRPL